MELYIVRHGRTLWNVQRRMQGQMDIPLDEEGRKAAELTARALSGLQIDRCISSPLSRALETARILLGSRNVPIETDRRIMEISFGIYEGLSRFDPRWPCPGKEQHYFRDDPVLYRPPQGGESFGALLERTGRFLDSLDKNSTDTVLVSTHGTAMRALLAHICHRSLGEFWYTGVPANCAVAHIVSHGNAWEQTEEEKTFYEDI